MSTAQGVVALLCWQGTLLTPVLLGPLPVHQVIFNSAGSQSVSQSLPPSVQESLPSQLQVFPFVLTEFYEVSVSTFLQPAEVSPGGSIKYVEWFPPVWCHLQI